MVSGKEKAELFIIILVIVGMGIFTFLYQNPNLLSENLLPEDQIDLFYNGKITLGGSFIQLVRNESSLSKWINFTAYENDSIVMTIEDFYSATEHVLEIHLFHKNYNDTVLLNDYIDKRALGWWSLWNTSIEKDEKLSFMLNPDFLNPAHLNPSILRSKPSVLNPSDSYWFYFRIANLTLWNYEPRISFYLTIGIEKDS